MSNEQKNMVEQYLYDIAKQVNSNYPNLIDDDKLQRAKRIFINSNSDYEEVVKQINSIIEAMIKDREFILNNIEKRHAEDELSDFALDVDSKNNGLYLSQQQIDLLMITEMNSKEAMINFVANLCTQFPNKSIEDIIPNFKTIDLDSAKRMLYNAYQDSLDSYIDDAMMTNIEKAKSKLDKLGVYGEEQDIIIQKVKEQGLEYTLSFLAQTKGQNFMVQFNRVMRDDFENVKSVGYDEMVKLSNLIQTDESIDNIIIATGKFGNVIFSDGTQRYFDPYYIEKGFQYCKKHNLHMRYHALFDYGLAERLIEEGKTITDKDQILTDMKAYINASMQFIEQHNERLPDGSKIINVVEVFNELVEKNKDDKNKPYEMIWEKSFGITVNDLISCFEGIKKPNGVDFMYNETTLTECRNKRNKVEETLYQIEEIKTGFIDRFGDQAHLSEEDLKNDGIEIMETARLLKRIQDGKLIVSGEQKEIKSKKIEMTEHDFHFSKDFIYQIKETISKGIIKKEDIKNIKKNMQEKVASIYKNNGVKFVRTTYWTIFNKNDHNLCRANKKIITSNKENGSSEQLIDNMYAGTLDDGRNIKKINKKRQNMQNFLSTNNQEKPFDQRSTSEIQIAYQIREKNKIIAQQKQTKKQQSKPKTLVRTMPKNSSQSSNNTGSSSANKGFTNVLVLSLIAGFVTCALVTLIYFIVK